MKQVILMRTDLGMSVGKMCAQAAHACFARTAPTVVVKVVSEEQLLNCINKAMKIGLVHRHVRDGGHTEVPPGTITCGLIYGQDEKVNKVTGNLPLL